MNVMMFNTSELILDAVILSIVASTPEGISGFKIVQNVRSKIDVPENTFYPLLKQMQADGYLEVYHKDIGGRSRRFYKITDAGREHLTYCQQTWNNYLQGASSLLMNGAAQPAAAPTPAPQPQTASTSQPQPVPVMNVDPQVTPVSGSQPVPVMNVTPQVTPVSGSQPIPVMEPVSQAAPVPEPQPIPVMESVSQATPVSGSQPVPVMESVPQAAPVQEPQPVPVMNATPQINPATMQQQQNVADTEDSFHIGGASDAMLDFDFSIGDDDAVNSDDMGFSSDGDLFEFDSIPASSFISYDDAPAETALEPAPAPVYQEPVAPAMEAAPVYQEPVSEPAPAVMDAVPIAEPVAPAMEAAPVYQEPISEPAPVVMETTPNAESVAPVVEEAPVYQEPADEPATETINMNAQQPVYQEPADELATETIDMNAEQPVYQEPADELATETIDMNAPIEEIAADGVSEEPVEDDEADFLAEMAMGDSEENEEEDLPELESSVSDIATINALESMLTQLRSFESVMEAHPEPKVATEDASSNLNINDINAVAAMLNPSEADSAEDHTATQESTSTPVRYAEVRNKETDDSVNSLVDLLKDDDQPKKRGFFGRNKKKNVSKEFIADTPRSSSTPIPVPSQVRAKSESSPVPTSSSRMQEVRNPDSDDSVNSLVDLLKEDDSSSKKKGRKSRSAADEFRATAADISAMSSSVPLPKQTSSSNPLRSLSSSTPLRAFSSSNPVRAFSSSRPVEPVPKAENSQSKPVSRSSYREVPDADAVGGLADLLMEGKQNKSATPKIFKQRMVSSSQPLAGVSSETPVSETSSSEPQVHKPSAAKTFEEKAAAPNAKPVETTATITKPLEAKAISTKPTEAKPIEPKSVETKAVATPKPEAAEPAAAVEPEEAPMDDFKRRLLQAHLITNENDNNK
ncbi:hypothetical protein DXB96_12600 [Clostridium sp. OM07-10AC]|nr:hypothetical protein DXB96_12600 [Clostridium sp. OM07-10AC]